MEISEENQLSLASYLQRTLDSDLNVRRPAEQFLESVESNKNYALLLLHVINKGSLDMTVRVTAAVAFKNYIKRNWPPDEDSGADRIHEEDRLAIKTLIVNLMLSSSELLQKQLSDAVSIIGKYDFPDKWPNLLNEMIEKFSTGDFAVINGVLRTAHSLFKKYRYEFKSQKLWMEIKFVLDNFAKPLTDLFVITMQLTETQTDPGILLVVYNSLLMMCKIFHSLNFQDLPEFFEDNMSIWMTHFHTLLTKELTVLMQNNNSDEPNVIEEIRSQICDNLTMYASRYEEEFGEYLPNFVTDIWNLLTSTSTDPSHDMLVSNALQFLATVAERSRYQHLFEDLTVLQNICENVIVPNIQFRESDEELFEDNPDEYIRRDIEGSDVDTRRRSACDLVKVLSRYFEEKIMHIFGSYVQSLLAKYSESTQNWKHKDAALYLVISLAARGQTQKHGVTQASTLVDLKEFALSNVMSELKKLNVNEVPVVKADCIKYVMTFRSLLPADIIIQSLQHLVPFIDANSSVVHTYAAAAIEKILLVKDPTTNTAIIKRNHMIPLLGMLFNKLFGAMNRPGSEENEYVMRAMLRVIQCAQESVIPYMPDLLPRLLAKLEMVAKNPSKPNFNHMIFETIAISIQIVCKVSEEGVTSFETELFPIFQIILQHDVSEFLPYVFQLLSMLLEFHEKGDIPGPYMVLYPPLLSPVLWERTGNIHPLVRLLTAYIVKCKPSQIDNELKLSPLLGVFQKLIASKANDHEGFLLLRALTEFCPNEQLSPFLRQIFILLFQRLTSSKTSKYVRGFITFICFFAINYGASNLISTVDAIQPQIFLMVCEKIIIPDAVTVCDYIDKKIVVVGITKLLTGAQELYDGPYSHLWSPLLRTLLAVLENSGDIKKEDEEDLFEIKDMSYDTAYSRLVFASRPNYDPLLGICDLKMHLSQSLAVLVPLCPKVSAYVNEGLTSSEKTVLLSYLDSAGVKLS